LNNQINDYKYLSFSQKKTHPFMNVMNFAIRKR